MASFLNVLIFQGNVGADPEISTHGDRTQARFSVANTRVWTDRDGNRREETTWLQVRAWGRLAETARDYVRRGGRVAVSGRLASWRDEDGGWHHYMEATDLHLQDAPKGDGPPEPRRSQGHRQGRQSQSQSQGRQGQGRQSQGQGQGQGRQGQSQSHAAGGWGIPDDDEPPF